MPREPGHYGQRPRVDDRESAAKRLYGRAWRRASKAFLVKNPLCFYCKLIGRVTAAECVDHGTPHGGDRELFWDSAENWFASCLWHNTSKGDMTREEYELKLKAGQ